MFFLGSKHCSRTCCSPCAILHVNTHILTRWFRNHSPNLCCIATSKIVLNSGGSKPNFLMTGRIFFISCTFFLIKALGLSKVMHKYTHTVCRPRLVILLGVNAKNTFCSCSSTFVVSTPSNADSSSVFWKSSSCSSSSSSCSISIEAWLLCTSSTSRSKSAPLALFLAHRGQTHLHYIHWNSFSFFFLIWKFKKRQEEKVHKRKTLKEKSLDFNMRPSSIAMLICYPRTKSPIACKHSYLNAIDFSTFHQPRKHIFAWWNCPPIPFISLWLMWLL